MRTKAADGSQRSATYYLQLGCVLTLLLVAAYCVSAPTTDQGHAPQQNGGTGVERSGKEDNSGLDTSIVDKEQNNNLVDSNRESGEDGSSEEGGDDNSDEGEDDNIDEGEDDNSDEGEDDKSGEGEDDNSDEAEDGEDDARAKSKSKEKQRKAASDAPLPPELEWVVSKKVPMEDLKVLSVLRNVRPSDVRMDPYPHLVIKNAVHPVIYQHLAKSFPTDSLFQKLSNGGKRLESNVRYNINAKKAKNNSDLTKLWQKFILYHTSMAFHDEVAAVLAGGIHKTVSLLERKDNKSILSPGGFANYTTGVRGFRAGVARQRALNGSVVLLEEKPDVVMDCQIAINSPVRGSASTVRGPHVDNVAEIFAGLLYMRHPQDKSRGGALDVYRCRKPCRPKAGLTNTRANQAEFNSRDINKVRSVGYEANTFVMFVNSLASVHAVTPRSRTAFSRRLVNFVGVLNCRKGAIYCGKAEQRAARRTGVRSRGR